MPYRFAINGYGRIGRCVLRALYERGLERTLIPCAINEPGDLATIVHLTRYDSTHGRFPGEVAASEVAGGEGALAINADTIPVTHAPTPGACDWRVTGADVVLECSGQFGDRATAQQHLERGAGRLLFSQPADPDVDATVVYGCNHEQLRASDRIIANASCTTNALVPVIEILDKALGIECGTITTIHSVMNDQPVIDAYHHTDLRKTRSASQSIIPVNTGLARGLARLLPTMADRFTAQAVRVPTVNVSALDVTVSLRNSVTAGAANELLRSAAEGRYAGILGYTEEPLASCDFNHDPRSGIIDAGQTCVSGGRLLKVLIWFDNEWGFANRMLDMVQVLRALDHGDQQ